MTTEKPPARPLDDLIPPGWKKDKPLDKSTVAKIKAEIIPIIPGSGKSPEEESAMRRYQRETGVHPNAKFVLVRDTSLCDGYALEAYLPEDLDKNPSTIMSEELNAELIIRNHTLSNMKRAAFLLKTGQRNHTGS